MSITLSTCSQPGEPLVLARAAAASRYTFCASARSRTSWTSVDFPEPLTPVTQTNRPERDLDGHVLQVVLARAREHAACASPRPRRLRGTGIDAAPRQERARDRLVAPRAAPSGRPRTRSRRRARRPRGPMSTMWSASMIVASSCSTTISVLPRSRSRSSVSSSRRLSRWCSPIDGSSRMYSTPTRPLPICVASRMRCASPPGERARGAAEREVVEPDVDQEAQPRADLLHEPLGDHLLALGQTHVVDERERVADREVGHLARCSGPPIVTASVSGRSRAPLHARHGISRMNCSSRSRAASESVSACRRSMFGDRALDRSSSTRAAGRTGSCTGRGSARRSRTAGSRAWPSAASSTGCRGRSRGWSATASSTRYQYSSVADAHGASAPSFTDRSGSGHDQLGIDLEPGAEAVARLARPVGRVEREVPRRQLVEGQPAVGAGELLGEGLDLLVALVGDDRDRGDALGQLERLLDRVGDAPADVGLGDQPVDDDLDRVLVGLGEPDRLGEVADLAVDPRARIPLAGQLFQELAVLALAASDDRREHLEPRALGQLHHLVDDLLGGLAADRAAAVVAVRVSDPREQHPQVVVDLGDRADRRARVARGGLLVDRDRRREALDEVDVGLLHLPQELPRVGGQRLDVAALALGVDRVEGERGLARAGQAREDDQRGRAAAQA